MLTLQTVRDQIALVRFRDWEFFVGPMGDGFYVQVRFDAVNASPAPAGPRPAIAMERQHGRKWYISSHAVPQEIERTAHKAVLAAVEHEANEEYFYKNAAIHNPHINPDSLLNIAGQVTFRPEKEL